MKKKIKTYGVRGLMQWVCNIPVVRTRLCVEFSGGVLTQYGNSPAKFTTDDLLKQAIIENSKPYKDGKITLLSCVQSNVEETRLVEGNDKLEGDEPESGNENYQANGNDESQHDQTSDGENAVEVASLDDAKDYLNQKHGVPVRNLRSRQAILEAAKECGVTFKGL